MNKKGQDKTVLIFIVISILITSVVLLAFIPAIVNQVAEADSSILGCTAPTPILNTSLNLCTNASGVSVINATPTNDGLTSSELTLLNLIPLFLIMGFVFIVANQLGFFDKE